MISLDKKIFQAILNSDTGEVSKKTLFHYYQEGNIISANYSGGDIVKGSILGKQLNNGTFDFVYQHINIAGKIKIGKCLSQAKYNEYGKIKLVEKWQWLCDDMSSGESELIEIN